MLMRMWLSRKTKMFVSALMSCIVISCILLIGLYAPADTASAQITPVRDLPDGLIYPGDTFDVTVNFTASSDG